MSDAVDDAFRWQGFFQSATQPMFLLNRRRRILFVNRAWEACTGLKLADVRRRACRRRSASSALDADEAMLAACAPPADALEGRTCRVRRRAPGSANWWEIHFLPLAGSAELLGILGTIRVLAGPAETPLAIPEKLMVVRDRQAARYRLDDLGNGSPALVRLHEQARIAVQTNLPVTLLGDAGVGKQWLARAIHGASERRQRYFACIDAERMPLSFLGEFLDETRQRQLGLGAIYLREPGHLPREWQARLAETVSRREPAESPRLMVGFARDPRGEIQAGRLLEELYCALSALTLTIPPLRDRLADLPRFAAVFLQRAREIQLHSVEGFGAEAMAALRSYAWPGNLRELLSVLRTACSRAKGARIEAADLPFHLKQGALPPERRLPLDGLLEQVERRLIALALKLTQNNHTRAAELLEIWRPRLLRRMEKFGFKE